MIIPKITEMYETAVGGLYVVAEFRNETGEVITKEDFHWRVFSPSVSELFLDKHGRVSVNGERVFPSETNVADAVRTTRMKSKEEIIDEVLLQVIKFRDDVFSDEEMPRLSGDHSLPEDQKPTLSRRPRFPAVRGAKKALEGSDILADQDVIRNRARVRHEEAAKRLRQG